MHCFVGNLFRCKSDKTYKIRFNIKQMEMCRFFGPPCYMSSTPVDNMQNYCEHSTCNTTIATYQQTSVGRLTNL